MNKPCAGGCVVGRDPLGGKDKTLCANVPDPSAGDPCYLEPSFHGLPDGESVCGADRSAILECMTDSPYAGGGTWKVAQICPTGTKCQLGPTCGSSR
jgi:hypothetical protein